MARIYSIRMGMGSVAAGSTVTIYTCPLGRVGIVRDINVFPLAAPATSFTIAVNGVAVVFSGPGAAQFTSQQWTGRTVLVAGDILSITAGGGAFLFLASGYELSP